MGRITPNAILELLTKKIAMTTRQIALALDTNPQWIRFWLARLLEKGLIGKFECLEYIPPAEKPTKVIYWCKRENFNRVKAWLKHYSNIKVKRSVLLPKSLSKDIW